MFINHLWFVFVVMFVYAYGFVLIFYTKCPTYRQNKSSFDNGKMNCSRFCRTCLIENSDMNSLFVYEGILQERILLKDMLLHFASIEIEQGDGLPESVCKTCRELIHSSYKFKKLCERSNFKLQKYSNLKEQTCIKTDSKIPIDDGNHIEDENTNSSNITVLLDKNHLHAIYDASSSNCLKEIGNNIEVEVSPSDEKSCETNDKFKVCRDIRDMKRRKRSKISDFRQNKQKCLKKHSNEPVVENIRSHTCDICNKSFRYHSVLDRHKLIHSGEKPYLCNICGKGFAQMAYLKIHTFIHTGEKPYKCQVCDSQFSAPGTLMTHFRTHTGDRPHICKICGKSFPQPGYLSVHIRTHTGEKPAICKVCNKQFSQKGSLIVHMRSHSGEKPYPCTECGKSFAVRSTLIKHIRIHTGEMPYICKVCGQKFAQNGTMTTHMKVHRPKIC